MDASATAVAVKPLRAQTVLEVKGLDVRLPTQSGILHAVRGVSFDVALGETVCVVGESGCGKSMTSLAIMGLLPNGAVRTADRLAFSGKDLTGLTERQMSDLRGDKLSMIFQEPMTTLNPVYTIGDQLTEPLFRHRRIGRQEAYEKAEAILERVGISGAKRRLGQYPHQLSGGLRQRVVIAMALMCEPQLVIADEPTTALDVTIQAQILHLLKQLQREFGMGMLFITHDLGLVARLADRVVVMYAGQVVESGPAKDIFERPVHPYTQGLLRCIPIPGRTERGGRLGAIPGMVPSLIGGIEGCSFRSRCPAALPRCANETIELQDLNGSHSYRCVLDAAAGNDAWKRNAGSMEKTA
ncbi:ABC transporter ATP-binding protein [Pseudaminobacter sp. 19-2017]|uniref:ABC transporter ATP-binding protein n=1 Tax=Pseudaminobacter soli (ex Zhang et al. 2022) TaxID=2831468 RepID=A0A942E7E3_9HYPH|nr:ABC transporter ATP-binding protein [Pseudaminobacter soli]